MASASSSTRDPLERAALLGGALLALYLLLLTAWAMVGCFGVPPSLRVPRVDFAAFWGAARLVAEGRPEQAYAWSRLEADLAGAFHGPVGAPLPFYYPPPMLAVLEPLGRLPYSAAFAVWAGLGVIAYAASLLAVSPRFAAALAAFPAPGVLCCVFIGQNGLITAAALGCGLLWLERRPRLAGCVLALLLCKPQLAMLVPLALAADRRWRALAAMLAAALAITAAAYVDLGGKTFLAFAKAAQLGGGSFANTGWVPWTKVQSVYGVLRVAGVSAGAALGAHAVWAAAVALAVIAAWRSPRTSFELKAATLACAMPLATPYTFFYDTPLLGVAAAFLLRDAHRRGCVSRGQLIAGALAWLAPLAWYADHDLPVGPVSAILLLGVSLRRAAAQAELEDGWEGAEPIPRRVLALLSHRARA